MRSRPEEQPAAPTTWHALDAAAVLDRLQGSAAGLSSAEAEARLGRYGVNALPQPRRRPLAAIILGQLNSVLVYLLLLAAAASLFMGEWPDAGFIVLVLAINSAVGTLQEYRAEENTAALRSSVRTMARVRRDGAVHALDSAGLVPGDVVLLEAGGRVPADLRLLGAADLEADESFLTGESMPVGKHAQAALPVATPLAERSSMLHAGSMVVRGRCEAVVVATGLSTELGRIASSLRETAPELPLNRRMARFTQALGIASLVLVAVVLAIRLAAGAALEETLFVAIALAVSVIPEGLPVSVTVALSIATARMARRHVVVRQLPAVEGLGACTVVATDKTGTLTVNRLTATRLWLPGPGFVAVSGGGHATTGAFTAVDAPGAADMAAIRDLALSAALCNDATLPDDGDGGSGDTVDIALLVLASKVTVAVGTLAADAPRLAELPFAAERKYAATLNRHEDGRRLHVKGAAEVVVPMCAGTGHSAAVIAAEELAGQGYRVLAVATREAPRDQEGLGPDDLGGMRLLGLVGFIDPLRPEARDAVAACRRAGVSVRMITGDHALTAFAIAEQLGIAVTIDEVVTGSELAAGGDHAARTRIANASVFARVEPAQKVAIVTALRDAGHVVAMTGDGVNDAPALRHADIGVAMGRGGTDTAREAADIILADDNFASIVNGIEEGRAAYANIRKVVYLLVSTGAAEALMYLLSVATGLPLPLDAVQLLWLNLVTNGGQDVALAFERPEPGLMRGPPRQPNEAIFDRLMIRQTLVSGGFMGVVAYAFFAWAIAAGHGPTDASNMLLFLMVLFENVQAFNARSETRSAFRIPFSDNRPLIAAVVFAQGVHIAAAFVPGLNGVLGLSPIAPTMWLTLLGVALLLLCAMEADKAIRRRRMPARTEAFA